MKLCPACMAQRGGCIAYLPERTPLGAEQSSMIRVCSMTCLTATNTEPGKIKRMASLIDRANVAASDAAGEYVGTCGKSDLATMTVPEWLGLIGVVTSVYTKEYQRLTLTDDEIPY